MAEEDGSFISRWSRRKLGVREEVVEVAESPHPNPLAPAGEGAIELTPPAAAPPPEPPPPTLAEVAELTLESDYTRFVARGVTPEVKNAALKKLFTDPHFNIMDGLDTYIDDYGKPDPLPPGMLRQMVQSKMLGLFDDEVEDDPAVTAERTATTAPAAQPEPIQIASDEDTDLQLQPDHDAGRAGLEPGAEPHPGRQR